MCWLLCNMFWIGYQTLTPRKMVTWHFRFWPINLFVNLVTGKQATTLNPVQPYFPENWFCKVFSEAFLHYCKFKNCIFLNIYRYKCHCNNLCGVFVALKYENSQLAIIMFSATSVGERTIISLIITCNCYYLWCWLVFPFL